MKLIFVILLAALVLSCDNNPYNCNLDSSILAKNDSIMQLPETKTRFTSRFLNPHKEPKLETLGVKSYRLLVTYSWERDTWIYRFEKTANGGMLTIKKTYEESYKKVNSNVSDTTIQRELNAEKWDEIKKVFDANCFWTLPLDIDRNGLDGRICFLEAFDPDRQNPVDKEYFIAGRWSPEKNTDFRRICDFIELNRMTNGKNKA
jgi:hypothetical protein